MPSAVAIELSKPVITSSKVAGTYTGRQDLALINFVAEQIDVAIDLIKDNGKAAANPKLLVLLLSKKGLGIGAMGIGPKQEVGKCIAAVSSMSLSVAIAVAGGVATGGLALAVQAFGLLADAYAVYNDCSAPVSREYSNAKSSASRKFDSFARELEASIYKAIARGSL